MSEVKIDLVEETFVLLAPLYAVDVHGVCHIFKREPDEPVVSTRQTEKDDIISQSIVAPHQSIENSNPSHLTSFFSTQPFSILNLHENDVSASETINTCAPLQLSGRIASQYQNVTLLPEEQIIEKTKPKTKKIKRLNPMARQLIHLKKQLKWYLKKKKKKRMETNSGPLTTDTSVEESPVAGSSSNDDSSSMMFPSFSPDLSKRKYIYKDITASTTNHPNQINLRLFQCTQTQSSLPYRDSSTLNDQIYRPFYWTNHSVSLPDIRIGLSRHQSTKHLHKTVLN